MNKANNFSFNWLILKINNNSLSEQLKMMQGVVVDLGCGEAPYKADILKNSNSYIAVDWKNSPHNQSNVDVFADLVKGLPFLDRCADIVVSFQVMEHLPEPVVFLSEAFRILKAGGVIVITVPFMWHVHEAPYDYYRYTKYGLNYLLGKVGFVDIKVRENTGFWQMWVLKFNYHTARLAPGPLKIFWTPVWWLGQALSPLLDKFDQHPEETASYIVVAKKP